TTKGERLINVSSHSVPKSNHLFPPTGSPPWVIIAPMIVVVLVIIAAIAAYCYFFRHRKNQSAVGVGEQAVAADGHPLIKYPSLKSFCFSRVESVNSLSSPNLGKNNSAALQPMSDDLSKYSPGSDWETTVTRLTSRKT